jgi:hypothetical protein
VSTSLSRARALWAAGVVALAAVSLTLVKRAPSEPGPTTDVAAEDPPFAPFVEKGFPFIVSTVDARALGPNFSPGNVATRGIVLMLGNETYAVFDPDLLRMAVGWRGEFFNMVTMAQVSYQEAGNKANAIPRVLGQPSFTNGMYAGWMGDAPSFSDPRPAGPNPQDPGRGPLPAREARWNGVYVVGDKAVLSYTVHGTEIHEQPGSVSAQGETGFVRAFQTGAVSEPLTLVIADLPGAGQPRMNGSTILIPQLASGDTVTGIGVSGLDGARLEVKEGRYVTLRLPAGSQARNFAVTVWRGPAGKSAAFEQMVRTPATVARYAAGGPPHWAGTVETKGIISPDTGAYVIDRLTLPLPNTLAAQRARRGAGLLQRRASRGGDVRWRRVDRERDRQGARAPRLEALLVRDLRTAQRPGGERRNLRLRARRNRPSEGPERRR